VILPTHTVLVLYPKSNMVFGSQSQKTTDETETHISETQGTYIDIEDEVVQQLSATTTGGMSQNQLKIKTHQSHFLMK